MTLKVSDLREALAELDDDATVFLDVTGIAYIDQGYGEQRIPCAATGNLTDVMMQRNGVVLSCHDAEVVVD